MRKNFSGGLPSPRRVLSGKFAGFTILELLVAMAVLTILVVMLMGVVDSATKLWRENEKRVDAYREARAALNLIASDLRSMLVSTNTNYFSTNVVGNAGPGVVASNGCLFFLAALPPSAQLPTDQSDICAVGYYRGWAKQNVNFQIPSDAGNLTTNGFQLFRALFRSGATYSNLIDPSKLPLENLAAVDTNSEIVARNIVALEFRCYQTNGTNTAAFEKWQYSTNNPCPQMIEVRLTAISDEFARRLQGNSARWDPGSTNVAAEMRTFITRVQIPGLVPQ